MSLNERNSDIHNTFKSKILHLLATSLPDLSGYSIRSHNILLYQKKFVNPFALTSPTCFQKKLPDIINNIIYFRYPPDKVFNFFSKPEIFNKLRITKLFEIIYFSLLKLPLIYLQRFIEIQNPDIIHGHSTAKFAKYGEKIARKKKIPFIYEIRGFVEDTLVEQGFIRKNSRKYLRRRKQENLLMKRADLVITLGEAMKKDIIRRGIDEKKIFLVSNAVNTKLLSPMKPNLTLKKTLGLEEKLIIGYVGSIRKIEGLEILFRAAKLLEQKIKNLYVVIVGKYTTKYFRELKFLAKELGIENNISFIGEIPNDEIHNYYSIFDIVIIPRINSRVTRLVTPLKPLEAMAMGKLLITSDLPALKEMVKPYVSGDLFETENPVNLSDKIYKYISDSELRENLGKSARDFVIKNYDWDIIIKHYHIIYENLLNK